MGVLCVKKVSVNPRNHSQPQFPPPPEMRQGNSPGKSITRVVGSGTMVRKHLRGVWEKMLQRTIKELGEQWDSHSRSKGTEQPRKHCGGFIPECEIVTTAENCGILGCGRTN